MKKVTIIAALLLAVTRLSAQDSTAVAPIDTILLRTPKVELAKIFLAEVTRVTMRISTLPLDATGGDVPATKYTSGKFHKVGAKSEAYDKALVEHYAVIIPYADRDAIIKCIQYLRQIP